MILKQIGIVKSSETLNKLFTRLRLKKIVLLCEGDTNFSKSFVFASISQIFVTEFYLNCIDKMSSYYDEIEIEDFTYDKEKDIYTYPCPCGDKFQISTVWILHLCFVRLFRNFSFVNSFFRFWNSKFLLMAIDDIFYQYLIMFRVFSVTSLFWEDSHTFLFGIYRLNFGMEKILHAVQVAL